MKLKPSRFIIALIATLSIVFCLSVYDQTSKRVITLQGKIDALETKIEGLSLQLDNGITQDEFSSYRTEVNVLLEAQKWRYEEYKGLDEVLDAWFGKQQASIVKGSVKQ